ncbi:MAG: hypothetical protein Tsb0020_43550 [Haliangiales bacterium]
MSEAHQAQARTLHRQGNALLKELRFGDAIVVYRKALQLWNHPRIHYHLAQALEELAISQNSREQLVEAHQHITLALELRGPALSTGECQAAYALLRKLQFQLATVTIHCTQPGSSVKLNGQLYCTSPNQVTKLIVPGEHQLDVEGPSNQCLTEPIHVTPGDTRTFSIRRTPPITNAWLPWLLAGTGFAVGGAGLALHQDARADYERYDDRKFIDTCADGCRADDGNAPTNLLSRARLRQGIAYGTYAVSGGLLATGSILWILRQRKKFELTEHTPGPNLKLSPSASGESVGVTVQGRF